MSLENDQFHERRLAAEGRRQTAHEAAHRDYATAARAERLLWETKVAAARARLDRFEEIVAHIPGDWQPPADPKSDVQRGYVAALAQRDAAKAAVDQLPGAPDHAELRAQRDRAIQAADRAYADAQAAGFPE